MPKCGKRLSISFSSPVFVYIYIASQNISHLRGRVRALSFVKLHHNLHMEGWTGASHDNDGFLVPFLKDAGASP